MPLIRIQINLDIEPIRVSQLASDLTRQASIWLGKPEDYVQIIIESSVHIFFAGTAEPSAFVEVSSLGFSAQTPDEISLALCTWLSTELSIPQDRVFIHFFDLPREHWGWNGKTFG